MKRFIKKITALLIIMLMTISYCSQVFAYTVHLINTRSNGVKYYDNNGNHVIQDYYVDNQTDYSYYCLNGGQRLRDDYVQNTGTYNNKIKIDKDLSNITEISSIENAPAIKWLIKNIYTEGTDANSEQYMLDNLNKIISIYAPSGYKDCNVNSIDKEYIEVVQQMVIWSFTNNVSSNYNYENLIKSEKDFGELIFGGKVYNEVGQKIAYALYSSLYEGASTKINREKYSLETSETKYELTLNKGKDFKIDGENGTYILGPVQIEKVANINIIESLEDSLNVSTTSMQYSYDGTTYKQITDKRELIGKNYYVKFTTTENIKNKTINYKCLADLGYSIPSNGIVANVYYETNRQPILQLKKTVISNQTGDYISAEVEKDMDIALTKEIISVEHYSKIDEKYITTEYDRLKAIEDNSGKTTTDKYIMEKKPVTVQIGDYVTYKITIYNEGETSAKISEITDYLPENLSYVSAECNRVIQVGEPYIDDWVDYNNLRMSLKTSANDYVQIDKDNKLEIKIKCRVENCAQGTELVNIAAVTGYADEDNNKASTEGIDIDSVQNDEINKEEYVNKINNRVFRKRIDNSENSPFDKGLTSQEDDDDFEIVKVGTFDLALRKFITSVNGIELEESREPTFTVRSAAALANKGTAKYYHTKNPVSVAVGDTVIYTIRVYNEGSLDGYAKEITDTLPQGLEFVEGSTVNEGWTATLNADGTTTVKTNNLQDKLLKAGNDGEKIAEGLALLERNNTLSGTDYTGEVQIECRVTNSENDKLINVAEITSYGYYIDGVSNMVEAVKGQTERDSQGKNAITPETNIEKYYEETIEPQFEIDKTEYYGSEDDDDFEILEVEPFDLALRKFITSVNGTALEISREPEIDGVSLQRLTDFGTAEYRHPKNPITVKVGDKVIYTIRVYNEGFKDGYAKEITDYLPVGLKYVESEFNKSNGWSATVNQDGTTTVRTSKLSDTLITADISAYIVNPTLFNTCMAEVQIECEVTAQIGGKLVNVAEITKYGYESNNQIVYADKKDIDRDSEQNNVFNAETAISESINKYFARIDYDGKLSYYPGVQDDDDFEVVEVAPNKYKFTLNKVDQDGNSLNGAKFTIALNDKELINNQVVNGSYSKVDENAKLLTTYTYKVVENESAVGYKNILNGNYILMAMHLDENSKLLSGDYIDPTFIGMTEEIAQRRDMYGKYGFAIYNSNNELITEQNTDLYNKIKVSVNNESEIPEAQITIPNEKIKGQYGLEIEKVDTKNNKLSGVTFKVNDTETQVTGEDGKVTIFENKEITKETVGEVDTYTISEVKVAEEYVSLAEELTVYVSKKQEGDAYVLNKASFAKDQEVTTKEVKLQDGTTVNVNVKITGNVVTVTIPNKPVEEKEGKYSLEIEKIDTENNKLSGVTFKVNGKLTQATGKDGKVTVIENKAISKSTVGEVDTYTISEVNVSEKYISLAEELKVYVTKKEDDKAYTLNKVSFEKDKEVATKEAKLKDGTTVNVTVKVDGDVITITVPNKPVIEKYGKYSLEIEKIDTHNNKLSGVTFKVNDKLTEETAEDGKVTVIENKEINKETVTEVDTYTISEVNVSEKYVSLDEELTVYVTKKEDEKAYTLDKVSFEKDQEVTTKEVKLKDGTTVNVTVKVEGDVITVTVPNKPQNFDLALRKWVTKAIVTEDGKTTVTETGHKAEDDPEDIVKVEINRKKLNSVVVKFEYQIRVTNEGTIAGYAREISDYIPEGLKFVQEDNKIWDEANGKVTTKALYDTLLQPGESAEVTIVLTWMNAEDNMGLKINTAEISDDYNEFGEPDIDSTPNNKVPGEDDIDDAPVMLTISTGRVITYFAISLTVLTMLVLGIAAIKKYVL